MKKNKMLRLASVLLILVMLTTSIVGGTFAKYTTTGSVSDTARVAKWGVSITTENSGAFFANSYKKADASTELTAVNSVVAATTDGTQDKVVAPGTGGSTTFRVTGTPEVAFKLTAAVTITDTVQIDADTEVVMPAGEFEEKEVKVKPTEVYEPITFKIEENDDGTWRTMKVDTNGELTTEASGTDAKDLTLKDLQTALGSLIKVYEAGTPVETEYRITWTWPYDTSFSSWSTEAGYKSDYDNADILDTYLGNQTNAQQEAFSISVTATQID